MKPKIMFRAALVAGAALLCSPFASSVAGSPPPKHEPVPDEWLLKYHLDLEDSNVLNEDADNNGFTNFEKWKAGCNPTDKKSHPPYTTKLYLETFLRVMPLPISNGRSDATSWQFEIIELNQPAQIVKMGDANESTKYKIAGFVEKHRVDANGIEQDISEWTIENTENKERLVLVSGVTPNTFVTFRYFWGGSTEIKVKLGATFSLKPETDVEYKLIDVSETAAKIKNLKTNEIITIPKVKEGETFHFP